MKTGDQLPSMAVGNLRFAAAAAVDGRERRAQAVGSAPCPASKGSLVGWELFFFMASKGRSCWWVDDGSGMVLMPDGLWVSGSRPSL